LYALEQIRNEVGREYDDDNTNTSMIKDSGLRNTVKGQFKR
jgi:hypothetical protein